MRNNILILIIYVIVFGSYEVKAQSDIVKPESIPNPPKGYDVTFNCNVSSATLSIDGKVKGSSNGTYYLKVGSHDVKLTATGYKTLTQSIKVSSSQKHFSFRMKPSEAVGYDVTFDCNVSSATLSIDGKVRNSANGTYYLNVGSHDVKLTATGYEALIQSIRVDSSQKHFSFRMKSSEAVGYDVTFECNVPFATMTIDGKESGTASSICFLKTGSHLVKLVADGYEDYSQSISVNSKQRYFSMTMVKKKVVLSPVLQNLLNNMVYVEGGSFTWVPVGRWEKKYLQEKKYPLLSFSICKYEVTQEEWEAVMGSNPSKFKGAKLPVENVSWNDCEEFIRKLNQLTSKEFRLPTENEWEYAARGGSKSRGYKYFGSNDIGSVAWYGKNSSGKTHEVGQKQPNELGLYDMSGNVMEFCLGWGGGYKDSSLHADLSFYTEPGGIGGTIYSDKQFLKAERCIRSRVLYRNKREPVTGLRLVL